MATDPSILAWKIPMDRGAWWATAHGITKSQTRLSDLAQHSTMSKRIISTILGKGQRSPGIGPPPSFWSLIVGLGTVMVLVSGHLAHVNVLQ